MADESPGPSSSRGQRLARECARLVAALDARPEGIDADLRRDLQALLSACQQLLEGPEPAGPAEPLTALPAEHPWSEAFAEMLGLVRDPADESARAIRERLRDFPEAALNRALDVAAIQFYADFWSGPGAAWRVRQPERAGDFVQHLHHFLQQALRLFPFSPAAYQDYPDGWLQRVGGGGMVTGRVRRVLRPGLQDEQNQLRLPALVEVD